MAGRANSAISRPAMSLSILHVMPNVSRSFGGPTESLVGYGQAAASQGACVHVAAPAPPSDDERWLRETLPNARFYFFPYVGRHAWVVAPELWWWLLREVARFDLVHVHGLFNPVSSLAAKLSMARGVPTVMRPFGTLSRYTFSRHSVLKKIYFGLVDRSSLRRARAFHFTTEAEREEAGRLDLEVHERGHVVPPPWRGSAPDADLESKADRPTVLFLSRLHPKKNVARLIEAWNVVVRRLPDARLWIAGDGVNDYVEHLRARVTSKDLGDSVSFLGFVSGEEKTRVLKKSWMFVLPSHQENFGVAVLEALASGLPVAVSGKVQLAPFVREQNLGIVMDRTDPSDIVDGIVSLLTDASFRSRMVTAGPQAVQSRFSVDRVGRKLAQMYGRAVARGG